jgi:hypothetical protein
MMSLKSELNLYTHVTAPLSGMHSTDAAFLEHISKLFPTQRRVTSCRHGTLRLRLTRSSSRDHSHPE